VRDDWGPIASDGVPGHHAGEDERYADVEDCTDDEGGDNADGTSR